MTPSQLAARIFGRAVRLSRGYSSAHDGLDFAAGGGTPVRAAAAGTVAYAANALLDPKARASWAEGGGNVVEIDHGGQIWTQYAHLRSIAPGIRKGRQVGYGETIGYVGRTGDATGNHLHFGVWDRNKGRMIDPTGWNGAGGSSSGTPLGPPAVSSTAFIKIPEGKILTLADIETIMAAFDGWRGPDGSGLFDAPVSGPIARQVARAKLLTFVGRPWNRETRDAAQALLNAAAQEAGAVGTSFDLGLAAIGDAIGGAAFTFVVLGGIVVLFLIGVYMTVRGSPTLVVKRALT